MTKPARGAAIRQLDNGSGEQDQLVLEEPLLLKVSGQQLLTMRTPGDDLHLALGFLLSEAVVQSVGEVAGHEFQAGDPAELRPDSLELRLTGEASLKVKGTLARTHEIRSSCGVCGLTDPDELLEETRSLLPGVPRVDRAQLQELRRRFEAMQALFRATGACHGAAVFGADGAVWGFGEDVGRHNALDKAIGQAALAGHDLALGIAMLSGRAGFDLVMKCLRVGMPIILSISATSALSYDLCHAAGGTLVGFLREGRMKIYCDGGRITA